MARPAAVCSAKGFIDNRQGGSVPLARGSSEWGNALDSHLPGHTVQNLVYRTSPGVGEYFWSIPPNLVNEFFASIRKRRQIAAHPQHAANRHSHQTTLSRNISRPLSSTWEAFTRLIQLHPGFPALFFFVSPTMNGIHSQIPPDLRPQPNPQNEIVVQ